LWGKGEGQGQKGLGSWGDMRELPEARREKSTFQLIVKLDEGIGAGEGVDGLAVL